MNQDTTIFTQENQIVGKMSIILSQPQCVNHMLSLSHKGLIALDSMDMSLMFIISLFDLSKKYKNKQIYQ